jgi:hypothetical protein
VVFAINLPLCVAAILLAVRFVPPAPAQAGKRLDVLGVLMLGSGTAALGNAAGHDGAIWPPLLTGVG